MATRADDIRHKYDARHNDFTDPLVMVRDIVVTGLQQDVKMMLLASAIGAGVEARARASAYKAIMERFPEIDWGPGAKLATERAN